MLLKKIVILSMFFSAQTVFAEDGDNTSLDFGLGLYKSNIDNTDSGSTASLNQSFQFSISQTIIPELKLFASGLLNTCNQNSVNAGVKISPIDLFSLSLSGGIENAELSYHPDPMFPNIFKDSISLKTLTLKFDSNFYSNDTYTLSGGTGLTIFFPNSNDTFATGYNARKLLDLTIERKINKNYSIKTSLFYQDEQHTTDFFNQSQKDMGLKFSFKWSIF